MSTPVKKLQFSDPRLKTPVSVELSWDLVPTEGQKVFDRLDTDDSGDLSFSKEIRFSDGTAESFFRAFWAFGGDAPHNHFKTDEVTRTARRGEVQRIQGEVYQKVIRPIFLADKKDLKNWADAARLLVALGDPEHLLELGLMVRAEGRGTDLHFLQASESFLLEAKRLAAATRWGRAGHYARIEKALATVGSELEKAEADAFRDEISQPHFLLGPGAPAVASHRDLLDGKSIILRLTAPKGFDRSKLIDSVNAMAPRLVPSVLGGERSGGEFYALEAKEIVSDGSAVIRQGRLSSQMYQQERDFYHVRFTVKENGEAMQSMMGAREVRRFDLVHGVGKSGVRSIDGAVVLQAKEGKAIRLGFASDLHVNERDYEVHKVMIDSLTSYASAQGKSVDNNTIERIERFYESFNEKFEAAVARWNQDYREGKLDAVVFTGDLADFINIPTTSKTQNFRGTNFLRLAHILSKLEAPYFAKPGNHDVHPRPYPVSVHKQHFSDDPQLYDFLEDHYDAHRFTDGTPLLIQGVMGLLPRGWHEPAKGEPGGLDFYAEAIKEVLSDRPYGKVNDEGLPPYWRRVESNEAEVTALGNNLYLYNWKTNEEDFNQQRWAFERVNEPVGLNLLRSFGTYVFSQHVNGNGPRPEAFRHFVNTVESVKARGGTMIMAQHYPSFYLGVGPDQTADSEDSLRGPVNWALRLATWYYRTDAGRPVVDLVVAGHVHRYGEYDFQLQFDSSDEEKAFKDDLGKLLRSVADGKVKGDRVYDRFNELRRQYLLDQHLITDRYLDSKDGFPGPVVKDFNQNWKDAKNRRGSLFVNLPALGPTTADSPSGFLRVTIQPDGRKEVVSEYFFLEPDGRVLSESGERLPQLKQTHRGLIRDWFVSHGDKPVIPQDTDSFRPPDKLSADEQRARGLASPPLFDPLPLLCQYPKGKVCWGVGVGAMYQFNNQDSGAAFQFTPVSLTFPLSRHHHPVWGMNYLRTSLNYNTGFKQWSGDLSLGLGLLEPHVFTGFRFDRPGNIIGGGIKFGAASSMVIPAFDFYGYGSQDGHLYGGGVGLTWQWELLSAQPFRRTHHH